MKIFHINYGTFANAGPAKPGGHLALLLWLGQGDNSKSFKPLQRTTWRWFPGQEHNTRVNILFKSPPGGGRNKFILKKGKKFSERESMMLCK